MVVGTLLQSEINNNQFQQIKRVDDSVTFPGSGNAGRYEYFCFAKPGVELTSPRRRVFRVGYYTATDDLIEGEDGLYLEYAKIDGESTSSFVFEANSLAKVQSYF